jgi:nucleotide-binding universal stress UspA family protein
MKVAVFVDGTDSSREAVEEAVQFAKLTDASLYLVHSIEREVIEKGEDLVRESEDEAIDRGEELLDSHVSDIAQQNLDVNSQVISGKGSHTDELASYIEVENIDRVFIGHRGLTGRKEELFGSFAKDMIGQLDVPITIITHEEEE